MKDENVILNLANLVQEQSKVIDAARAAQKLFLRNLIDKLKSCSRLFPDTQSHGEMIQHQINISKDGDFSIKNITLEEFFEGLLKTVDDQLVNQDAVLKKIKLDIFGE
jgi:hypothetical protein